MHDSASTSRTPGAPSFPGGAPRSARHNEISSVMHDLGYSTREVLDWLIATGTAIPSRTVLTVSADCCLIEDNPTYNSEGDNLLDVRGLNTQNRHSIVRFDFSSLAGKRVLHADLQMYCSAITTAYGTNRIQTHPMTQNGIFVSAQTTWNIYATASNWSTAGGTYDTTTAYKSVMPAPLAVGWWSGNVTPTAQRLVTQGSASGEILLRAVTENGADAMVRFSDSDANPCELHVWTA